MPEAEFLNQPADQSPVPYHPIRFWLNGALKTYSGDPHLSLLQWLRQDQGLCGTKEGCAEGDCGACTSLLIELDSSNELSASVNHNKNALQIRPINSCIRLMPTLDGKGIVTIEGLTNTVSASAVSAGMALHPAQQAMIDCNGSQCGFCTPGFVISLVGLYKNAKELNRDVVCEALSGNLCRCTGYRPIINAALEMVHHSNSSAESQLSDWQQWLRTPGESTPPASLVNALREMRATERPHAPKDAKDISKQLAEHPDAWLLAGGTDIGLWINKALQRTGKLIYLGDCAELQVIRETETALEVRAAVTLDQAFAALDRYYPQFQSIWKRFASLPVRSSATLCGNIANGSPIGDSMPILIALGAEVELASVRGSRRIPLEQLYLDYKKQSRARDEWVYAIHIPKPDFGSYYAAYKLSKRPDQDISAVLAAIALQTKTGKNPNDAPVVSAVRIAFGGMAGIPKRASHAEAALLGQPFTEATVRAAMQSLAKDFAPISDMRASSDYRAQTAGNLLLRFFLEHGAGEQPTRVV